MIRKVGVIGAGTIGTGLTELLTEHGIDVITTDKNQDILDRAKENLIQHFDKAIEKFGITNSEKKLYLSKVTYTLDKSKFSDVDLLIEAVDEIMDTKKEILAEMDQICKPEILFATSTSTLSITELGAATNRADKIIGLHMTHPVVKRDLVQIVRGLKTSDQTFNEAKAFVEQIGKTGIQVFESPGYVTVRLMMPLINEAIALVNEGVASAEDIDTAMKLGFDFPYGPLEMADRMGLDSVLRVMEMLFKEYGEVRYRPALMVKKLVNAGHLGEKTNEGFFKYENGERI